jgi:Flp pilus assembly protein TadG
MTSGRSILSIGCRGAAAVEFAIVLPLLLLLLVGSVELGRVMWTYNTMLSGVEEGARYVLVHARSSAPLPSCDAQSAAAACPAPSGTPLANCAASQVQDVLQSYQASGIGVSVREDASSSPPAVTLCASYLFDFIAPAILPPGSINLNIKVTVPFM